MGEFDLRAFGRRLRAIRAERLLSQEDVARMVGTTAMSISRYERGRTCPSARVLWDIADALGTTPDELVGWDDGR